MSEDQGGTPSPVESAEQLHRKLGALERMRVAGLVGDRQYEAMRSKLEAQLGMAPPASPPAVSAPPAPWTPPAPPPPLPAQPQSLPQSRASLRTPLIATGLVLALFAATFAGVAVISRHPAQPTSATALPSASDVPAPTDTPTPDPAAAVAALRNFVPPKGDFIITPARAEELARAFWPVREMGLSQRNPHIIHAIEDGAAGEWDMIGCTMGCPPPSPRPLKDLRVFVPEEKAYPAYFMAQVLTTQYHTPDALVEIMVYTRKSATAPWYLSFDTNYSGVDHLHEAPHREQGNSTDEAPPKDPAVPDLNALPGMLAAYWQHWKDSGSAPPGTRFRPGAFTTQQGQDIYQTRLDDRGIGIEEHVTYSADPAADGVWSFTVDAQENPTLHVLTCGTVRYRSVNTPLAPSTAIEQDGLDPFGDLLAPGRYASVTEMGVHESCILTHPGDTAIEVEGLDGEQTKVIGVPANGAGATL